ncbi:hypothetical protein KF707_10520 [Candidatus Obscuribacterales bacterium]|jgi:hypothetical protein|nr:hypothetical protein [Candidatus Obscuribacterales bacterium]MBX3152005.1 hypothetical protein [Candidatus Obscuribacterales bacterium]
MKPNLGLSILIGGIFSTFITSIYILMSVVPTLIGTQPAAGNPLGDAITVWFVLTFVFSFLMHEWQRTLEEFNKRGREEAEAREKREREEQEARKRDRDAQ